MPSDELGKALSAAFERDPWIAPERARIVVSVSDGVVTLEGEVERVAAKRRAFALAEQELGEEYAIADAVRRKPIERLGDLELARAVVERFAREAIFAEHTLVLEQDAGEDVLHDAGPGSNAVRVAVRDGIVSLSGTVESLTHRRLAEVMTWWIGGCESVRNELSTVPPEEDNDSELNDAVRFALEMDPTVDASRLSVSTASGVVSMEGYIDEAQKRLAIEDAWLVPGVRDVDDRIHCA